MSDVWPIVHAERAALIADLETLTEAQWDQPSLCDGWSVHDVVAHIIDTAMTTRLGFVYGLARAGFDFDRQNAEGVERERGPDPAATLLTLREVADRTWTPPAPMDSRIVEMVVHGEDIRRPLGITRSYPQDAVARAGSCRPVPRSGSVARRNTWMPSGSPPRTPTSPWATARRCADRRCRSCSRSRVAGSPSPSSTDPGWRFSRTSSDRGRASGLSAAHDSETGACLGGR